MASILPSFEYDIFISYRHNDNRSGWVTEFVNALREELAATIKEPLSIYFDQNPHDGLLETHNVDKSLEGKLKCLIFIPIISQTYCDTKSFAWQHEFVAFNKLVKEDQFGRDIKLSNGNVASRILPIKIHDLDADDRATIENEIGGALRAIEFIYKEPGVNRPLKLSDNKIDNQNKTDYRNQLNKVANAIKEIITALKNPVTQAPRTTIKEQPTTNLPKNRKPVLISIALLLLIALGYFLYQQRSTKNDQPSTDKSIAVLPFVNMSNDPEQEYFSDGISEEVLNLLAKVPELKVIGRTSSFYFKGKNEDLREIGKKLGASHLLEGSLRKDGGNIRITAQLIRASDGIHIWSETFERKLENIFQLQDEIAHAVLVQLRLKLVDIPTQTVISDQEVHNLILKGRYFFNNGDYSKSLHLFEQALALDSTQVVVWTSAAQARATLGSRYFDQYKENFRLVRKYAERAISIDASFSDAHRVLGLVNLLYDFNWNKARQEFNLALQLDPNNSDAYRNLGQLEGLVGSFETELEAKKKSIDLNPLSSINISNLALAYSTQMRFDEAEQILTESLDIRSNLGSQLMEVYLQSNKVEKAQKLFEQVYANADSTDREFARALTSYASGKKSEALVNLRKTLKYYRGGSFRVAEAFAFMDQKEEAFHWLSKAFDEKFRMQNLKRSLPLRKLHDDPRYEALLKKMNLPLD